jgi:hypothetical protein
MLKITGPVWITVYDVADIFDLPVRMVGRLHTAGLVAVVSKGGVYRYHLGDVEALANTPGWFADRARARLKAARRNGVLP